MSKITLTSTDGDPFEVEEPVAAEVKTITQLMEGVCANHGIPLPDMSSEVFAEVIDYSKMRAARNVRIEYIKRIENLDTKECVAIMETFTKVPVQSIGKVMEYCEKHVETVEYIKEHEDSPYSHTAAEGLKLWDGEFVKLDPATLVDLNLMANAFNIESLLSITGKAIASLIHNESPRHIRNVFHIVNDFTGEENVSEMELRWLHQGLIVGEPRPEETRWLGNGLIAVEPEVIEQMRLLAHGPIDVEQEEPEDDQATAAAYGRNSLDDLDKTGSVESIANHLDTYDMANLMKVSRKLKRVWIGVFAERIKHKSDSLHAMEVVIKRPADMCRVS